jgi:hypothetical protein
MSDSGKQIGECRHGLSPAGGIMISSKYESLVSELKAISLGLYPAAVSWYNDERDYTQRDGFKDGWNAAIMEHARQFSAAVDRADFALDHDEQLFRSDDATLWKSSDGTWEVFLNDTWYYACGDAQPIEEAEKRIVADWYRRFGQAGVYYWVSLKRGHNSEIPKIAKVITAIKNLVESGNSVT